MHEGRIDASCGEEIILAISLARKTRLLRRRQVPEVRDPAIGESDRPYRVDELWRNIRPIEWPIVVRPAVARRCFVTQINPRFSGMTTDVRWNFLIRCAPRQPYRIHRHAWANLSLTDQCLISWRKGLIHFRMLRNPASYRCATAEDHCASGHHEHQRNAPHLTQHEVR